MLRICGVGHSIICEDFRVQESRVTSKAVCTVWGHGPWRLRLTGRYSPPLLLNNDTVRLPKTIFRMPGDQAHGTLSKSEEI